MNELEYALLGTNPNNKNEEDLKRRINEEERKSRKRNAKFQQRVESGEVIDPATARSIAELLYFSGTDGFVGWVPNTPCMYGALNARGTL